MSELARLTMVQLKEHLRTHDIQFSSRASKRELVAIAESFSMRPLGKQATRSSSSLASDENLNLSRSPNITMKRSRSKRSTSGKHQKSSKRSQNNQNDSALINGLSPELRDRMFGFGQGVTLTPKRVDTDPEVLSADDSNIPAAVRFSRVPAVTEEDLITLDTDLDSHVDSLSPVTLQSVRREKRVHRPKSSKELRRKIIRAHDTPIPSRSNNFPQFSHHNTSISPKFRDGSPSPSPARAVFTYGSPTYVSQGIPLEGFADMHSSGPLSLEQIFLICVIISVLAYALTFVINPSRV